MSGLLRVYEVAGEDGYPPEWHRCPTCAGAGWVCAATGEGVSGACELGCGGSCPSSDGCPSCTAPGACGGTGSAKALVRALAGDRCVRCHHPFVVGSTPGEWSPCDERCAHGMPARCEAYPFESLGRGTTTGGLIREAAQQGVERVIEAQWRVLTVHHLQTDSKLDCRWWNLCALCQRCHLEIQGKVRMDRRWLHEHSAWFKPYVAGYYAWTKLGEDLSRPEVEARLDELLALEDRQLELGAQG